MNLRTWLVTGLVVAVGVLVGACGRPDAAALSSVGLVATTTTIATVPASAPSTTAVGTTPPPSVPRTTTTVLVRTVPPSTVTTAVAGVSGVQGTVRFGPVCPVQRIPPDPRCAPRPGPAHVRLVRTDGVQLFTGEAGADGRFSISAGPGTYAVEATTTTSGPGGGCRADPAQVTVERGSFASTAVTCDTGIR